MISNRKIVIAVLFLLFFYLLVLQIIAIWPFTVDDMYISLRYAKNWSDGNGLLWNLKEPPVEGYSNFSFVALGVLAIKLGMDPVLVLKSAGYLGLCLSTVGLFQLTRFWFKPSLAVIPCLWFLLYGGQVIWAVSGLETTVFQALLCFSLISLLKALGYQKFPQPQGEAQRQYFLIFGLLMAFASLTRPEAPMLFLLFCFVTGWDSSFNKKKLKELGYAVIVFSVIYVPYFAWRLYYFGKLFPNPVYCKGFSESFFFQVDKEYLRVAWIFILFALTNVWKNKDRRHYFFWLPSFLYLILLLNADTVVAFANRLFLPALALLFPIAFVGMVRIISHYVQRTDEVFTVTVMITAALIAFFYIPSLSVIGYRKYTYNAQHGEQLRKKVILWLDKNTTARSSVVLGDSGMIPYQSRLNFIDSWCLNNREMAEQKTEDMYENFCRNIVQKKPEVIILTSLIGYGQLIYAPADLCLHNEFLLNKSYVRRVIFQSNDQNSTYRYEIYTPLN